MAHKKKHGGPVPPANKPHAGPAFEQPVPDEDGQPEAEVASAQEHDPKRRLGEYAATGEHPFQQPGGRNDANH